MLAVLAAAAALSASSLDLDLVCPGEYQDVERVQAETSSRDYSRSVTTTVNAPVTRTGSATISLHGSTGQLVYPDGRTRDLASVVADEGHIEATYVRRMLIMHWTWRVNIDRTTGNVRVSSGQQTSFTGVCAPKPKQAKF